MSRICESVQIVSKAIPIQLSPIYVVKGTDSLVIFIIQVIAKVVMSYFEEYRSGQ